MRAIAIGNFDGVHRGHLALLERARVLAAAEGFRAAALTFEPHPADVLAGKEGKTTPRLAGPVRKHTLLSLAVPEVHVEPFTLELAQETPREFVQRALVGKLGAKHVVVGENFRFGHRRSGDVDTLRELGAELGFEVHPVAMQMEGGLALSSSRARTALLEGRPEEASTVLGRHHAMFGEVMHGDARGRTLGVPTANLLQSAEMFPGRGIYAVWVGKGGPERPIELFARGVASVGTRPTIDPRETRDSVEVHLFDVNEDLYGQILSVAFVAKLRDEERFESLDALTRQMRVDLEQARALLAHTSEALLA